jgi:hypothetical protein
MHDISLLLKSRREALGISIDKASAILKVRPKHLIAIEDNYNVYSLAPVYRLAHMKVYADFLGLDGQRLINQIKKEQDISPELYIPKTYTIEYKPGIFTILASLFMIFCIYLLQDSSYKENFDESMALTTYEVEVSNIQSEN